MTIIRIMKESDYPVQLYGDIRIQIKICTLNHCCPKEVTFNDSPFVKHAVFDRFSMLWISGFLLCCPNYA